MLMPPLFYCHAGRLIFFRLRFFAIAAAISPLHVILSPFTPPRDYATMMLFRLLYSSLSSMPLITIDAADFATLMSCLIFVSITPRRRRDIFADAISPRRLLMMPPLLLQDAAGCRRRERRRFRYSPLFFPPPSVAAILRYLIRF